MTSLDSPAAIEALLNATLYPALVAPLPQEKIHDGRKRIDISYTNVAKDGFFLWLARNYAAANVVVEAKNYERPLANPEYDQITGRFSPSRGKVGLLIYQAMEDKQKVLASCRDAAKDDHGFVLALDDADLGVLVDEAKRGDVLGHHGLLRERFRGLTVRVKLTRQRNTGSHSAQYAVTVRGVQGGPQRCRRDAGRRLARC